MLRLTDGMEYYWIRIDNYDSYGIWGFWIVAIFLFGCCWGSFLNVCIWRMPRGESVIDAPSHCPKCNYRIRWFDNIPLFSYLALRGRCRGCRSPISPRYWLVELLTGALFVAAFLKVVFTGQPAATVASYFPMIMLGVATFFIDCRHRIIPDQTTYPAMLLGVIAATAFPAAWGVKSFWLAGLYALLSAAVCGGLLGAFALIGRRIAGRDVLGWGDIKYMMAAGALLGLPGAVFTLFVGSMLGSVYGVAAALRRKRRLRGFAFAFGPFLAIASMIWIFCGEKLLRLYLQLPLEK